MNVVISDSEQERTTLPVKRDISLVGSDTQNSQGDGNSQPEEAVSHFFGKRRIYIPDASDLEDGPMRLAATKHAAWEKIVCNGFTINFPFKPYQAQVQLMEKLIEAMERKQHALLESPTGTGKTMALLSGTLAWLDVYMQRYLDRNRKLKGLDAEDIKALVARGEIEDMAIPRIYYSSRTHKQISQVVKELRRSAYAHHGFSVLASRTHYCINDKVRTEKRDINEACLEAMRASGSTHRCHYLNGLEGFSKKNPEFVVNKSVSELVAFGKRQHLCPYYLARQSAARSQIVFCPFDYLVNDIIRDAMDINIKDSIVIVDEGHNIEDVCRDAGSFECDDGALYAVQNELTIFFKNNVPDPRLALEGAHTVQLGLVELLLSWMNRGHEQNSNSKISFDKTVYEYFLSSL